MADTVLRSFRVANHRSIREEAELLLLSAYDKARPVTTVAAIFGANASGKSNVVDALRFMWTAVRSSYRQWEAETGVPRVPFRLSAAAAAEPSFYAVDLVLDGVRHLYGFTVDDERVIDEWLYHYPHGKKAMLFERNGQSIELGSTIPERHSRTRLLRGLMRDNSLLLSAAVQANQGEVVPVYRWFHTGLSFGRSRTDDPGKIDIDDIETSLHRHRSFVDLVRLADFGITDLRIEEPDSPEDLPPVTKLLTYPPQLLFAHGPDGVLLTTAEQSDGTIAWLKLLSAGLDALAGGAVCVIDEIDASLHPRLTARLIELFKNKSSNRRSAQLIFTTHDATLLGTSFGRDVLARDEVWFVEKDKDGATTLYPLTDFHPRNGENTERRYLGGSYGAVPAVFSETLVERVAPDAEH